jgi:hypothetical protein
LAKLAETQSELQPVWARMAEVAGGDDALRTALRGVESVLGQLLADQSAGREAAVQEVRAEIRLLARTIAALAEGEEPR